MVNVIIISSCMIIIITTSVDDQQHHNPATNNHNEAYNDNVLDFSSQLLRSRSLLAETTSEQQLVDCKKSLLSTHVEVNQLKTKMKSMDIDLQNVGDMLSSEVLSRNQLQKQLNAKRAAVSDLNEKLNVTSTRLGQKIISCKSEMTTLLKSCTADCDKTTAAIRKELKDMKDQAHRDHVKLHQKEDELQQALEDIDALKMRVESVLAERMINGEFDKTRVVVVEKKKKNKNENEKKGKDTEEKKALDLLEEKVMNLKLNNYVPDDSMETDERLLDPLSKQLQSPSKTYPQQKKPVIREKDKAVDVSKPKKDERMNVSKPKPKKVTYSSLHSQIDTSFNTADMNAMFKSITDSSKAMTDLLQFETWSTPHSRSSSIAIFTCALSETYIFDNFLVSTIRRSGYSGDLVVAVLPNADSDFLGTLKLFGVTVYTAPLTCSKMKRKFETSCDFLGEHLPLTLIRSFIYQYWALQYPDTTYIMMSDFRDVIFQSNPFTLKNKFNYWGPSAYDITFFAEHHPNRVINRCKHTSTTLNHCYGRSITDQIGTSTIINNGVVFATRNASLIYVSFTFICNQMNR